MRRRPHRKAIPLLSSKVFFSFLHVKDPSKHREHNAWHQLDHLPENRALPGVVWGDRWVRTPDCIRESTAGELLAPVQYVAQYWFREPLEQNIKEWVDLGEQSFQWGRRPELTWIGRPMLAFFSPVKGYVNPRVLVSADVLPFRPVKGMHVRVTQLADPHSIATEEMFRWYDTVRIPRILECAGVAGAWTFSSQDVRSSSSQNNLSGAQPAPELSNGGLRVTLTYLDEEPAVFRAELAERDEKDRADGRLRDLSAVETVLLDTCLEPITPWEWDWFD